MINAVPIAVSGLTAAATRLAGVAGNLANQRSAGPLQPTDGAPPAYAPVVTVQQSAPGGGTAAAYRPAKPATLPSYEPDSPLADGEGMVAEPNVDPAHEMTEMLAARQSYEANLKTVRTATEMQDSLLRIVT
jgi:flagellar basal-body rod protein FlgC